MLNEDTAQRPSYSATLTHAHPPCNASHINPLSHTHPRTSTLQCLPPCHARARYARPLHPAISPQSPPRSHPRPRRPLGLSSLPLQCHAHPPCNATLRGWECAPRSRSGTNVSRLPPLFVFSGGGGGALLLRPSQPLGDERIASHTLADRSRLATLLPRPFPRSLRSLPPPLRSLRSLPEGGCWMHLSTLVKPPQRLKR